MVRDKHHKSILQSDRSTAMVSYKHQISILQSDCSAAIVSNKHQNSILHYNQPAVLRWLGINTTRVFYNAQCLYLYCCTLYYWGIIFRFFGNSKFSSCWWDCQKHGCQKVRLHFRSNLVGLRQIIFYIICSFFTKKSAWNKGIESKIPGSR